MRCVVCSRALFIEAQPNDLIKRSARTHGIAIASSRCLLASGLAFAITPHSPARYSAMVKNFVHVDSTERRLITHAFVSDDSGYVGMTHLFASNFHKKTKDYKGFEGDIFCLILSWDWGINSDRTVTVQ